MAHIQKYKAPSVGHMLAHYRRDKSSMERDNIDPKRTKDNMVVAHYKNKDGKLVVGRVRTREGEPNWETVQRRIERVNEAQKAAGKRATRKDAVVLADIVVTLPENVRPGDEDRFFRLTYWYLSNKLGRENMMGGFVHKDECRTKRVKDEQTGEVRVVKLDEPVRDHMHVPFTPILDGSFNYKKMCPRAFYKTLHKELGDYLERRLGYRPEVELSEEKKAEKVLSQVPTKDVDAARAAIVEPAEDEAARIVAAAKEEAAALLKEAETRKAELVTQIADKEGDLAELDSQLEDVRLDIEGEQDRLECLRRRADGVARDVGELRPIVAEVRGWEAAGKAERGAILDSIAAQCDGLAGRVRAATAGIRLKVEELRSRISRPLEYLMRRQQPRQESLAEKIRHATAAADAWNRSHVAPTRSYRGHAK